MKLRLADVRDGFVTSLTRAVGTVLEHKETAEGFAEVRVELLYPRPVDDEKKQYVVEKRVRADLIVEVYLSSIEVLPFVLTDEEVKAR